MNIEYYESAINAPDGGVSCRIKVNEKVIALRISMEALQDIDPSSYQNEPLKQFEKYKAELLVKAKEKIIKNQLMDDVVWVRTSDL
ncbi:hypothetical protein [Marinicellulosiphila megalodicopiae]|uniref:hypothetical protein n=1 Tax=Marinicellulosiphila megalodicopiae TaxID=2724896 RepID=UPI003BB10EE0